MTKLKITRCKVSSGDIVPMSGEGNIFSTAINPSAFSRNYKTGFSSVDNDTAIGKSEPVPKNHRSDAEQLSLTITLDGTGVVRSTVDTTVTD